MRHTGKLGALLAALAVSGGAIAASSAAAGGAHSGAAGNASRAARRQAKGSEPASTTPIKHVVVIFQENISFDHYFGTYPKAANSDGQPFKAGKGTPAVDGLTPATAESLPPALRHSGDLRFSNPNAAQPQRLDSSATGLAVPLGAS
jgi:phospholipase C